MFEITQEKGFCWLINGDETEPEKENMLSLEDVPKNKHELAAYLLKDTLAEGEVAATDIKELMGKYSIGEKTLHEVKSTLGIESVRRMRKWYWKMPGEEMEGL